MTRNRPTPLKEDSKTPEMLVSDFIITKIRDYFPDAPDQQIVTIQQAIADLQPSKTRLERRARSRRRRSSLRQHPSSLQEDTASKLVIHILQFIGQLTLDVNLVQPSLHRALTILEENPSQQRTISATREKTDPPVQDPIAELRESLAQDLTDATTDGPAQEDLPPPTIKEHNPPFSHANNRPTLRSMAIPERPAPLLVLQLTKNKKIATETANQLFVELLQDLINDETPLTRLDAHNLGSPEVRSHISDIIREDHPLVEDGDMKSLLFFTINRCQSHINGTLIQVAALIKEMEEALEKMQVASRKAVMDAIEELHPKQDFSELIEELARAHEELQSIVLSPNHTNVFSPVAFMDEIEWKKREYILWFLTMHFSDHRRKTSEILPQEPIQPLAIKEIGIDTPVDQSHSPRSTPPPPGQRKRLKGTLRGVVRPKVLTDEEIRINDAQKAFEGWLCDTLVNDAIKKPDGLKWIAHQLDAMEASCMSTNQINSYMARAISYTKKAIRIGGIIELPLTPEHLRQSIVRVRQEAFDQFLGTTEPK